jgi:hypothetical protein
MANCSPSICVQCLRNIGLAQSSRSWLAEFSVTGKRTDDCSTNLFRQHTSSPVGREIARISASVDLSRSEQDDRRTRTAIELSRVEVELFEGTKILVVMIDVLSERRIACVGRGHDRQHGCVLVLAGHVGRSPFIQAAIAGLPWLMLILVECLHKWYAAK